MPLKKIIFVVFAAVIFFFSCKKDLLSFQKVTQLNSYTTDRLDRIYFINDSVGFVSGGRRFTDALILQTTDGGNTWQNFSFPVAGKEMFSITMAPGGTLYSTGFDGKLLYSGDKGSTWNFAQMNYFPYLDIAFADRTHGVLVGGVSFNSGFLAHIDNKGNIEKWDSLNYQLNRIKMVNSKLGYICGYGLVMQTKDGGNTWTPLNIKNDDFTGIDLINNNEVWVCGYNGSVYHSVDTGATWQRMRNGNDITIPRYNLYEIIFKDAANGWAVGENGVVIHTDDGGNHWEQYQQFTNNALRSIAICANGDLLVCGDNGALYRVKTN